MSLPPSSAAMSVQRIPARVWALVAALVLAAIGFQLVYGLRLVSAGDAYWSNPHGDMGQMLAGELAGLRAPWTLPILTPDTLLAPERVSLVYTDSIPWLTALLKLTHLGGVFSLMGTFLLLAWLAQPVAMYGLLRACGVERASTLLAGCLLALMAPQWLSRQMGHIALSGQAIQIAALALAVHAIRQGMSGRTTGAFVALGVFAVGVHAYHVPPVALMLATAVVSEIAQRRAGAARRGLLAGAAFLVSVGIAAWVLGYGVGRGPSGGVDALGIYEMNLLSPIFPNHSVVLNPAWIGGWFTRAFGPANPEQDFEGYNYVGAGVFLLLVTAAFLLRGQSAGATVAWADHALEAPHPPADRLDRAWLRRWGPLAVALGALTLYALGTQPYVGALHVLTVPLPHRPWMEPFALFRGHGRFFWTVGYALLAAALTVVDRAAGRGLRIGVLLAAVLLQAADTGSLRNDLRTQFAHPEPLKVPAALRDAAFHGRDLRISPGFFCTASQDNMARARQLSIIAQRNGASTNVAEVARGPSDVCPKPEPDLLVDAAPGDRRITVVQRGDRMPVPVTNAFTHRHDCFAAEEGLWFCGRALAGTPGLQPVEGRDLATATTRDAVLDIGGAPFNAALAFGWSSPETDHVWSDGRRAVLRLPHPDLPPGAVLVVDLELQGFQPAGRPPQRVRVSLPDGPVRDLTAPGGGYAPVELRLPADRLRPGPVELAFELPDALSPRSALAGSSDPRVLGIGLRRITLAH